VGVFGGAIIKRILTINQLYFKYVICNKLVVDDDIVVQPWRLV